MGPWAPCCRPRICTLDDSPGWRDVTRSSTSTAPTCCAISTARISRRARTRSRPTRSAATCPTSPTTTSRTGSASCRRRAPGSRARSPTRWDPAGTDCPGSCWDRWGRAPSCPPWAMPGSRRCATPTSEAALGMIDGGADAILIETCQDLLQVKAAVIGSRRAMDAARRAAADHHPRHRRDHRHHAGRQRDRRGADGAGAAGHRHDRPELRHRPGRDERASAPPVPARADPGVGDAQRGPAGVGPQRRGIPAAPRGTCRRR